MDGFLREFGPDSAAFWKAVEEMQNEPVPNYLKCLITAAGYDRYSILSMMSPNMKDELEQFAREEMSNMFQSSSEYFHIYYRNPKDFHIVPGHWKLLLQMSKTLLENKKLFTKFQRKFSASSSILPTPTNVPGTSTDTSASTVASTVASTSASTVASTSSGAATDVATIQKKLVAWHATKDISVPTTFVIGITGYRKAYVSCCYCSKHISLSTRGNKNGTWGWIVSNYTQHILQHTSSRGNTIQNYFRAASEVACNRDPAPDTDSSVPNDVKSIQMDQVTRQLSSPERISSPSSHVQSEIKPLNKKENFTETATDPLLESILEPRLEQTQEQDPNQSDRNEENEIVHEFKIYEDNYNDNGNCTQFEDILEEEVISEMIESDVDEQEEYEDD